MGNSTDKVDDLLARVAQLEAQLGDRDNLINQLTSRTDDFAAQTECWFWETDANQTYTYISDNLESVSVAFKKEHFLGKKPA